MTTPTPPPPSPTLPPGADGEPTGAAPHRPTIAEMIAAHAEPPRPVLFERPEGCICDFAHTGGHRFSCATQGRVVLPLRRTAEGGFRADDAHMFDVLRELHAAASCSGAGELPEVCLCGHPSAGNGDALCVEAATVVAMPDGAPREAAANGLLRRARALLRELRAAPPPARTAYPGGIAGDELASWGHQHRRAEVVLRDAASGRAWRVGAVVAEPGRLVLELGAPWADESPKSAG